MLKNKMLSAMGGAPANYIEDVFSTYLYTGNGSTQTITNGIDLAGEGGLVWVACRSNAQGNYMTDTVRGATKQIAPFSTAAQNTESTGLTSFSSTGFTVGSKADWNFSNYTYASWTFRKQPKFFDVVTWTGDGVAGRQIAHSLGSTPGCIIVKNTSDGTQNWVVKHRSSTLLYLNLTNAAEPAVEKFCFGNNVTAIPPDASVFTVGSNPTVNANGATYVAYLFAHNAGGFGLTGTDNVISCGSFTTDGSNQATVELGYEPQWIITKRVNAESTWNIIDNMRSWNVGGTDNYLFANLSNAEATFNIGNPTATGFFVNGYPTDTYIYIAIRRGPMKVPESGTSVFDVKTATQAVNSSSRPPAVNFVTDFTFYRKRETTFNWGTVTRLAGSGYLFTNTNNAEASGPFAFDVMNGFYPNTSPWDSSGDYVFNYFRRAPGFMDVVCYAGAFTNRQQAHNLGVVPEMMIVKARTGASAQFWDVYHAALGASAYLRLDLTDAVASSTWPFNGTTPTSSLFYVGIPGGGNYAGTNANEYTYVAYLFASAPGVSKVGSYTGTGTTQQINCGFTGGARFVLIKRTDSTGSWYVWDSSRGIVSGNDPYLLLNSTAAEVTNTDYVDTASVGFEISSTAPAEINASGGSFIFLAIA